MTESSLSERVRAAEGSQRISVVIPIYNGADIVKDALASIVNQSVSAAEIIIVDDCSSDVSELEYVIAANSVPIKLIRESKNAGAGSCRNRGVQAASGDFIAFLDADDTWPRDYLARQLEVARQSPDESLLVAKVVPERGEAKFNTGLADDYYLVKINSLDDAIGYMLRDGNTLQTSGFFIRRNVAISVMFDPLLRRHQDIDYVFSIIKSGGVVIHHNRTWANWRLSMSDNRMSRNLDLGPTLIFIDKWREELGRGGLAYIELRELGRREWRQGNLVKALSYYFHGVSRGYPAFNALKSLVALMLKRL